MASLSCELSGEPLHVTTDNDVVVVTPSGHVCLKKLLLVKLAENGGVDPFTNVPLAEDQLVTLSVNNNNKVIPPRPSVSSMPHLLGLVGNEYSSLVLELFDTRKALEETRKELSHALYQNDAAVRVVARLAQERDTARQELSKWKSSSVTTVETTTETAAAAKEQEPPTKKVKTTTTTTGIPQEDLESMTTTWQRLSGERKSKKKTLVVIPPETLATLVETNKQNWHKTRNKAGIVDMRLSAPNLITAGRDKQLVVYSLESKTLLTTINVGVVVKSVDMNASRIIAGLPNQTLVQYNLESGEVIGEALQLSSAIVNVTLHPTGQHVMVTCENASVVFCGLYESSMSNIYTFEAEGDVEYSAGGLHPDGLICAAGTSTGQVHLWDFKNQTLASTYEVSHCCCWLTLRIMLSSCCTHSTIILSL